MRQHDLHVLHGQKQKRNLKQRQLRQRAGSALYQWGGRLAEDDKKPWVEIDLGEEREVRECKIRWFRAWKKPPAKWRVSPALPARTRYVLIEIDDISPNKLASIEEVEIQNAALGD